MLVLEGLVNNFLKTTMIVAAVAAAVPTVSSAHSIWFAQRGRQLAMIYGVGADDLDAVKRLPLVKATAGYDADWKPVTTALRVSGPIPVVDNDAPVAAITAAMDYGMWSKTPDGAWINKGKNEVPNAVVSERNWKYAVHITNIAKGEVPLLANQTLQLIPVGGVIPQDMGKPITLRAMFNGKPVAGVEMLFDYVNDPDQKPVKTAADGTITFPVRNQGLNVITGIYFGPTDDAAKYERMEHRATLSFVLPHLPE
jgi:nickel transport protein